MMFLEKVKKRLWIHCFLVVFMVFWGHEGHAQKAQALSSQGKEAPILYLYHWYGMIPKEILEKFEEETGIHVSFDAYESNHVLESKLLAGHSGYDVVGPSAFPYLARQVPAGLYLPLDRTLLPHYKNLNPHIMKKMAASDPGNLYAVPMVWGTVGLAFQKDKVTSRLGPLASPISWDIFLNPDNLSKLKSCGVTFLEESSDTFLPVFLYLGLDPKSSKKRDLNKALETLMKIRPSIKKFDNSRAPREVVTGQICMAWQWVGDVLRVRQQLPEEKRENVVVTIPKEGTVMWIDCLAIPKDATHPQNAHKFIDFLMRPDIIAMITNKTFSGNAVDGSKKYVDPDIQNHPLVFPSPELLEKIHMNPNITLKQQRDINRAMMRFRTGR